MEVFADCGLFEAAAFAGMTALAQMLYSRRIIGYCILVLSVAVPLALVFLVDDGIIRWVAAVSLGTAFLNATVIVRMMKSAGGVAHPGGQP